MRDTVLNEDTKVVLQSIYDRGLIVLMSYGAAYPRYGRDYDDGDQMPHTESSDWIHQEPISMGEYFEEKIGLLSEYKLTGKALELMKETGNDN